MIGFLVENGNDPALLNNITELSKNERVMVFSESLIPNAPFNAVQTLEAFHYNGNMITSSPRLCQQLQKLGYTKNRYLYVKNMFWEGIENLSLSQLELVLFNQHISLVLHSSIEKPFMELFPNVEPAYIMQSDWDINILRQIANE